MPSLREVQRAVARSILSHDDSDATQHLTHEALVSADRLSIYRNNFTATAVTALRLSYPVVEKLVGPEFFEGAARIFIERHPPRTAYFNDYGAEFADFLANFGPAAQLPYLPDVARLEWSVSSSLNAADAPALDAAALARVKEADHTRIRFVPHPSLRLLSVVYPADVIWRSVLAGDDASLGVLELTTELTFLLVHRGADGIVVRRLTHEEARLTAVLCSGAVLAEALLGEANSIAVALLADHLANGRFAGFESVARDQG